MKKIEFELTDDIFKWLRHYQLNPKVNNRASREMKNLRIEEFCKAIIDIYVISRLKEDGKL